MDLKITNTITGKKEKFTPLKKGEVSIYVCGVTLYDDIHIGHLKSIVAFEVIRNYFIENNYNVKLVRNITDVDDKIIAKAEAIGVNPLELVNEYIRKFHDLLNRLDIPSPDIEPRVTQYLNEIQDYIQVLKDNGTAYEAEDGIYFNTQINTPEFYPLSKKNVKDLEDHTRLNQQKYYKKHNADFALWKEDKQYGYKSKIYPKQGRPGWHIECSAMHHHTLGKQFDIHGGGRDLIFPHHENEILQSVAHNGINPANYWVHNGMMTKNGKKLSKSFGNSIYVKDILEKYSPESIKMFLNKGQYNQSQEFNEEELKEADQRWDYFVENIPNYVTNKEYNSIYNNVISALSDDFNTPLAISILYAAFKELSKNKSKELAEEILNIMKILSIINKKDNLENIYLKSLQEIPEEILLLVKKRQVAKANNDYKKSDEIRDEINLLGFNIIDNKNGYLIKKIK